MVQKTVLKVKLTKEKCRKKILKSVSGLYGVVQIEIDAGNDTLTVTGDTDPYEIIKKVKKVVKCVEVVTIGPPPKVETKPTVEPPTPPEPCIQPYIHMPPSCVAYSQWPTVVHVAPEPCNTCPVFW